MNIIFNIIMSVQYVLAAIPLDPFMYDEIQSDKYIIDNAVSDSTQLLQYDENSMVNDMKDKQFWEDFQKSLHAYDKLLNETKITGEYYDIDFDEMNRGIMEELCEEMDGIEEFCVRNTKTFELTILEKEKEDEPLDVEKIVKRFNSNDTPYNVINY